jgi:hypothetical protein
MLLLATGCSSGDGSPASSSPSDAGSAQDASPAGEAASDGGGDAPQQPAADASADAGKPECAPFGAPGRCLDVATCASLGDHSSYPGYCPGPQNVECCIDTPDVSDDPPTPTGYKPMDQSQVTPEMTSWAVMILDDTADYPMFSTTTRTFGAQLVLARVEWHPPDFQNSVVHRGVTLYVPG